MTRALRRAAGLGTFACLGLLAGADLLGQAVIPPPDNITLPNYESISIGQNPGLEAGAYIARTNDAASNWYNPAGLSLANTSSVSSSAGTYQVLSLTPKALEDDSSGSSTQTIPALVGVLIKRPFDNPKLTAGLAFIRTLSWDQETDAQRAGLGLDAGDLLTYSADSEFSRFEASAGLGYDHGNGLRFGAALSTATTDLRSVASIAQRLVEPTGLEAVQVAGRATGGITQLRMTVGAQYQFTPQILFGAQARTTGLTLWRSGGYVTDGMATAGGATASYAFFDQDIRFDYKLPFEFGIGAAYSGDRIEVEVDARLYTGHETYDMFRTNKRATIILDPGDGTPPIVDTVAVENIHADADTIVNFSIGGHYFLTENRVWQLHFGFNTDFSPVGDGDEVFSEIDLYGITAGISGQIPHFSASLGVRYQFGSTDRVPLATLLESDISVHTIGFIYSLAYRF